MDSKLEIQELAEQHEAGLKEIIPQLTPSEAQRFFPQVPSGSKKEFALAKFLKEANKEKLDWRPGANKTSITRYVMPSPRGEILALGVMRFPLDAATEVSGGNLECIVPPSLRRKGYGSYCLALMLFEAVRAGLRRVLVTCSADDLGAAKMIKNNRGVLQDTMNGTSRYWINF